ncbi:MAG TPA: hypothetical protein PKD26_11775 [Pyrinomonadaceae bacterium]|nr:hypothetical protein [Pyrinomonadaceae bacterium]
MLREFKSGDLLVFQIESGFCLLRILGVESSEQYGAIWHVRIYGEFYQDVDSAELALNVLEMIEIAVPHAAMTDRAFLSTQASLLRNIPIVSAEVELLEMWRNRADPKITDRSVRLLLGLR